MEWIIILAIVGTYSSICSKLDKIISKQSENVSKTFPSLNKLVGKRVSIEMSDASELVFGSNTNGILKEFNNKWVVIETKGKKNVKELYYYRLNNIVSIDLIDE